MANGPSPAQRQESVAQLDDGPEADVVAALGSIFEHAAWVAESAARHRPFGTVQGLFARMRTVVQDSGPDRQLALLRGHPELAGSAARAGSMTADSVSEQSGAGLVSLSDERGRVFDGLNAAYAAKFGFPFIVAVRRHGRDSLLREFRRRLEQPAEMEHETALTEVFRIAALRLDAAVSGPDRLSVHGHLSTHVLDNAAGRAAEGVPIELFELSDDAPPRSVAKTVTNRDGRTGEPLIGGRPLPIATYELRVGLGAYFRRVSAVVAEPAFLDTVPVRFGIAEPEGRYHVPVAATPWSYGVYRGS